jgi:hypothetical protein
MLAFRLFLPKDHWEFNRSPCMSDFACVTSGCSTCWRSVGRTTDCQTLSTFRYIWWQSWTALQHCFKLWEQWLCVCVLCVCVCGAIRRDQWRTQEFFFGGGCSTNSVEHRRQREEGSGGSSPLVRGSGGSCNLVKEVSFHILKFS